MTDVVTRWHENVLLTCPVPGCGGQIRSEYGRPLVPCTWNACCSPECGQWIDGYLARSDIDDEVRRHWTWNVAAADQAVTDEERLVRACTHEWQPDPTSWYVTGRRIPTPSGFVWSNHDIPAQRCPHCHAKRPDPDHVAR